MAEALSLPTNYNKCARALWIGRNMAMRNDAVVVHHGVSARGVRERNRELTRKTSGERKKEGQSTVYCLPSIDIVVICLHINLLMIILYEN